MRAALLTREYPPDVYGGAGVHVEYLARELRKLIDVDVHAWGADREGAIGHEAWDALGGPAPELAALRAMSIDLTMAAGTAERRRRPQPHLVREPRRPPGQARPRRPARGHRALARAAAPVEGRAARRRLRAVVASASARRSRRPTRSSPSRRACARDLLERLSRDRPGPRVRSSTTASTPSEYAPDPGTDVLERHGIDPGVPTIVFVGRITRQKGVAHLLEAMRHVDADAQLVLCAGAPGHAGDRRRGRAPRRGAAGPARQRAVARTRCCPSPRSSRSSATRRSSRARRSTSRWASSTSRRWRARRPSWPRRRAASSRSSTTASPACSCPSSPATTPPASRATRPPSPPPSPSASTRSSATRARAAEMGRAGRARAVERFAWPAIAQETVALYQRLL